MGEGPQIVIRGAPETSSTFLCPELCIAIFKKSHLVSLSFFLSFPLNSYDPLFIAVTLASDTRSVFKKNKSKVTQNFDKKDECIELDRQTHIGLSPHRWSLRPAWTQAGTQILESAGSQAT